MKPDRFNEVSKLIYDLKMSSDLYEMYLGKDLECWFNVTVWPKTQRKQIKRMIYECDGMIRAARLTRTRFRRLL
jgi:hypothetical protein